MKKVYIVAYGDKGYMVPIVNSIFKSRLGAEKAKKKYLEKLDSDKNNQFVKILCADNWHEEVGR